jgi:hypothetical protein
MILLYTLLLFVLGSIKLAVGRRATSLGRKYSTLVEAVQKRLRELNTRPGNGWKGDVCHLAKNQYELAQLVQQRDRVEARHYAWQHAADRLGHWGHRLRAWKGQKLPYTLGAVDVWLVLTLIDHAGVGELVSTRRLYELVAGLFAS